VTSTQQSGVDDATLLSAFEEPEVEPKPAVQPETKPEPQPTTNNRSSVLSSGIEMPTVLGGSTSTKPVDSTPVPQPVVEEPSPSPVEQTTEVVGTCGDCGQQYAVDMPIGIKQAQIDCPKCGKRSTIRR
jgi:DNA-directed RNA polymerase subunit RPC12/RpoP